jgi:hypothetical protein
MLDDPELDCTPFAHPAWIRGNDAGVLGAVMKGEGGIGKLGSKELQEVCDQIRELVRLKDDSLYGKVRIEIDGINKVLIECGYEKIAFAINEPINTINDKICKSLGVGLRYFVHNDDVVGSCVSVKRLETFLNVDYNK